MKPGNHLTTIITHVFPGVEFFASEQAQTCAGYRGLSHLDLEFESTTVRTIGKDHSGIENNQPFDRYTLVSLELEVPSLPGCSIVDYHGRG